MTIVVLLLPRLISVEIQLGTLNYGGQWAGL